MTEADKRREIARTIIEKAWEDENFKNALLADPKAILAQEFGQEIPADLNVNVVEDTESELTLVIPRNPNNMSMAADTEVKGPVSFVLCSSKACCGETSCWACE